MVDWFGSYFGAPAASAQPRPDDPKKAWKSERLEWAKGLQKEHLSRSPKTADGAVRSVQYIGGIGPESGKLADGSCGPPHKMF